MFLLINFSLTKSFKLQNIFELITKKLKRIFFEKFLSQIYRKNKLSLFMMRYKKLKYQEFFNLIIEKKSIKIQERKLIRKFNTKIILKIFLSKILDSMLITQKRKTFKDAIINFICLNLSTKFFKSLKFYL